jgi:hypothetical protein
MWRDLTLAALAVTAYFGYYLLSDPWARGWFFYSMVGFLVAWLAWSYRWRRWWGQFACALLVIEGVQQGVCGLLTSWGPHGGADVCMAVWGVDAYRIGASIALAGALVWGPRWLSRQAEK